MEEDKAAEYYEELTRKGEGAARFKQGLGFSTSSSPENDGVSRNQISSSSFRSNFVKASSPNSNSGLEREARLHSIQNKLKKKEKEPERERNYRDRERERKRDIDRDPDRRRDRDKYRDRDRRRRRSRSTSWSPPRERRRRSRSTSRSRSPPRERRRRRSRSYSPKERRSEENRSREGKVAKTRTSKVDYSRLIEGYGDMTPAERVKAKMKLQLAETAEKDETKGMGSGWERFDFDKDAPLDDEELEAVEDDAALVKHIGQSFRFSAIEARREEQLKAAHDEAMFGASAAPPSVSSDSEPEADKNERGNNENAPVTSLLSEKVLAKPQGSWRDRLPKVKEGSTS